MGTEGALFDFNRHSHGVGQEIELATSMLKIGFPNTKVSHMIKEILCFLVLNYMGRKNEPSC